LPGWQKINSVKKFKYESKIRGPFYQYGNFRILIAIFDSIFTFVEQFCTTKMQFIITTQHEKT
jgi:hypothetical protein